MKTLVDNDVLMKGACYGLLHDLILAVSPLNTVGILGTARYVVPQRIRTSLMRGNHVDAAETFRRFVEQVTIIEPTEEEQQLAADLELAAQRLRLSLDSGESQLCAVLSIRLVPLLLTGDKRAITAMDKLLDDETRLSHLAGKIMCLEQLFVMFLGRAGNGDVRRTICAEPDIDKALSNCFSCYGDAASTGKYMDGLTSYIESLRRLAARVLCANDQRT